MRRFFLGAFLALAACRPEREADDLLASRIAVADKRWNGVLVELGTPLALPLLDEGWSYGETAPDGNTLRWASDDEASFRFHSNRVGSFVAWLEVEPFVFDGAPSQWLRPEVNGAELDAIELRAGRGRYPLEIPVARGENRIHFRFRYAGDPNRQSADRRRLAVAFYRFEVPFAPDALEARQGAFTRGQRGVYFPANGSLTIYAGPGERAKLEITLGATEGGVLAVSVGADAPKVLKSEGRERHWEATVPARDEPVAITLASEAEPVWVSVRLLAERNAFPRRPAPFGDFNVVMVVLDGANALRTGPETTPNLHALGKTSVVFETAVSQAVYTIASIGSVLTGQYPDRHQSVSFDDRLRDDAVTIPARLSAAGIRTAAFSGNAVVSKVFGLDKGYESFVPVWELSDYTGHGDSVLREFRRFVDGAGDGRFFAYVHFREPHFPYNPPSPFDTLFGPGEPFPAGIRDWETVEELNRGAARGEAPGEEVLARIRVLYEGNLAYVDSLVGELLSSVDERRSVVLVTADHGEALFEHGYIGHNTQLYEESIRVPLMVRIPGVAPRRIADVVELIDVAPTLLELFGQGDDPAIEAMQGRSLLSLIQGASDPHRLAFSRTVWDRPRYSVRNRRHKLIWDSRTGEQQLYELEKDPAERNPLQVEDSEMGKYLVQELMHWYSTQEALRAGSPPPGRASIGSEDRRIIESLGYASQMKRKP